MMSETVGTKKSNKKEIGMRALEDEEPVELTEETETADIPGGKTLDEISEEVP